MFDPRGRRVLAGLLLLALCLPLAAQEEEDVGAKVAAIVEKMEKADDAELWRLSRQLDENAVPVLKDMLAGLAPRVRLAVARALIDLGDRATGIETLIGLAAAEHPEEVRVPAIELLGEKGSDAQEEVLVGLLDDAFDPRIRIALARTLWSLTYSLRAKEELKAVLASTDDEVRIEGALALAEIGAVDAAKPILVTIEDEPTPRGRLARALLEQARWREMVLSKGPPGGVKLTDEKGQVTNVGNVGTVYSDELLRTIQKYIREYYLDAPEVRHRPARGRGQGHNGSPGPPLGVLHAEGAVRLARGPQPHLRRDRVLRELPGRGLHHRPADVRRARLPRGAQARRRDPEGGRLGDDRSHDAGDRQSASRPARHRRDRHRLPEGLCHRAGSGEQGDSNPLRPLKPWLRFHLEQSGCRPG